MIGRGAERRGLNRLLDRVAAGEGRIVTIEGQAGIGKTSLLSEALARARAQDMCCWVAAAEELERHRPFGAMAQALGVGRGGRPAGLAHSAGRSQATGTPAAGASPALGTSGHLPVSAQEAVARAEDALLAALVRARVERGSASRRAELARMITGDTGPPASAMEPGGPEAEFRIVDGLVDLVGHLSSAGPLVLALEDLQWADPSTLAALNRLSREISRQPVLVILTMRPLPRSAELLALLEGLEARGATRIHLEPLDGRAIAQIAEGLLGARPGPGLLRQLARAGGNPFFACELVAAMARDGEIRRLGGVADADDTAMGSSLATTILRRLSLPSEDARETLQVASILGSSFSVADLGVAVGKKASALNRLLAACVQAGILADHATQLTFRHDLVREALYLDMQPALRAWLHLAAAHVLAESGRPPEEIARHVIAGAVPGDLEAVEWLRTAARQAASRSPHVAAELLRRAIELAPTSDPHHQAALVDLAGYLLASGQLRESGAICRQLLDQGCDARTEATVRVHLVEAVYGQGKVSETEAELEKAMSSQALTGAQRCRLGAWSSSCRAAHWDLTGCVDAATAALAAAGELHGEVSVGVALGNLALVAHWRGAFDEGVELARQGLAGMAGRTTSGPVSYYPPFSFAGCLLDLDRTQEALETIRAYRRLLAPDSAWDHPFEHLLFATAAFQAGEWGRAITALQLVHDAAETSGNRRSVSPAHAMRSLIALHRGDLGTAEQEVEAAEADARSTGPQWRPDWMMWARALLLEAQGRPEEALGVLTKAWELCRGAGVVAEFPVIGPDLVRLALAGGETILAAEVTAAVGALASDVSVASVTGAALRCRGMLEGEPGVLLRAVEAYRASPRRRELALACEDAAVALACAGRPAEGRPLAEEALDAYRSLGARRDSSRAQARLRAAGIRSGSRGERARPKSGWASLTQAEIAVAMQVAGGSSNPEIARRLFISRRTVQSHVSHILEKLTLTSRVELAVETTRWQEENWQEDNGATRGHA